MIYKSIHCCILNVCTVVVVARACVAAAAAVTVQGLPPSVYLRCIYLRCTLTLAEMVRLVHPTAPFRAVCTATVDASFEAAMRSRAEVTVYSHRRGQACAPCPGQGAQSGNVWQEGFSREDRPICLRPLIPTPHRPVLVPHQ